MADRNRKWSLNVDGEFYVDETCIDCDLCRVTASDCFTANEDDGHSYVFRQPESEEELALSNEAMRECPVEAIGCDGKGLSSVEDRAVSDPGSEEEKERQSENP